MMRKAIKSAQKSLYWQSLYWKELIVLTGQMDHTSYTGTMGSGTTTQDR